METHAIIIITEWDEFKELNYGSFYSKMERPSYMFDGRNIMEEKKMSELGYIYCRVGKRADCY